MHPPYDQRGGKLWMDGELIPWNQPRCHVLTHALHYASAVFEGLRVYDGNIYKLHDHTRRLFNSAQILGFDIPWTPDEVDRACRDAVAAQELSNGYARPIAWRGSEEMGVSARNATIHLAVAAWAWGSYFDPEERLKGIRMDVADWRRPSPQTAPCHSKAAGLYMICTLSRHAAEAKGYADALMLDYRGHVAEATGANIFFVVNGELHTPTPDCFLDGITRRAVIDLARARGINVVERHINPDELESFEQCFITGTAAEVTPVSEIGSWSFVVGDMTKALADDYLAEVRRPEAEAVASPARALG